jgi:hypothetical protein
MAKPDKTKDDVATATQPPEPAPPRAVRAAGENRIVYVGATVPGGRLRRGAVFKGTREQVLEHFEREIDSKIAAPRDFVPASKLAGEYKKRSAKI